MSYYSVGEIDGPGLAYCGVWVTAPGSRYGPHAFTDRHSLFWVIDGSAIVREGDREDEIPPNGISCMPPDVEYEIVWDPKRSTRFGSATFVPDPVLEYPRVRRPISDDIVIPMLNHLAWMFTQKPPGWKGNAKIGFEFAMRAYRTGEWWTRVPQDGGYTELVTRTLSAVRQHWFAGPMTTPSLSALAAELGVTARHLGRAFDSEFGAGPITVFRTLRILRAARLLTESTRPIREISAFVGFANPYHFASVFKSTMGMPPGEYRFRPPTEIPVSTRIAQLEQYVSRGMSFSRIETPDSPISAVRPDAEDDIGRTGSLHSGAR